MEFLHIPKKNSNSYLKYLNFSLKAPVAPTLTRPLYHVINLGRSCYRWKLGFAQQLENRFFFVLFVASNLICLKWLVITAWLFMCACMNKAHFENNYKYQSSADDRWSFSNLQLPLGCIHLGISPNFEVVGDYSLALYVCLYE